MRFERITARGIGPFGAIDVDLAAISGLLVAVTGKNGAGKSTFLELLGAALYRKTRTRGTLASLATTRSSLLEVRCVNGATHTVKHVLDVVSGKGDSVVMDETGRSRTDAGLRKEYDAFAAKHFPHPDVFYASTFTAQDGRSFVEASEGDRKAILLRALGIERLEALTKQAGVYEREAKAQCAALETRLADERARALPLDEARAAVDDATLEHEAAQTDLEDARRAVRETSDALSLYTRTTERRRELHEALAKQGRALEEARGRSEIARDLAERATEIADARTRAAELEERLVAEQAAAEEATRALAAVDAALADARRAAGERTIIEDRIQALDAELVATQERLAALHPIIGRADAIRAAVARAEELGAKHAQAQADFPPIQAAKHEAEKAEAAAVSALAALDQRIADAESAIARLEKRVADEVAVRAAADEQSVLDGAVIELRRERESVREQLAAESNAARTASADRIGALREGLFSIVEATAEPRDPHTADANAGLARGVEIRARQTIGADDDAESRDAARPVRERALDARNQELYLAITEAERRSRELQREANRLDGIVAAKVDLEAQRAALVTLRSERESATQALSEAEGRTWAARKAYDVAFEAGKALRAERKAAEDLAGDRDALTRAEAQREGLEADVSRITTERAGDVDRLDAIPVRDTSDLEAARAAADATRKARTEGVSRSTFLLRDARETLRSADDVARAGADLEAAMRDIGRAEADLATTRAALETLPLTTTRPDVAVAQRAEEAAQANATRAAEALTRARAAYEISEASATKRAELERDLAAEYATQADWSKLAADLGRDGIQALEIDAAGPELTAIANDLLHTCVSRRWTIAIHTQRLSADGKKTLEGCEVEITDVEAGRIGAIETFSGGERVLIGEAVSLALSVLACRRAGVERPTLVRDESGAALDASNGRAYVDMLRRAAVLIGAAQVLFVSHSLELQELADARIHIENGTATVIA